MPARCNQMRLLTLHLALFQSGAAMAGGFIGAYLLSLGFSLSTSLAAYACYLALRSVLRFAALAVVRLVGYARTLMLGTTVIALQFVPLMHADRMSWLAAWMFCVALGEALYFPVYHATTAVSSETGTRGRQLAWRAAICTFVAVLAPLAGAVLLTRFGPAANFGIATVLNLLAALPLLHLGDIPAGPVPRPRETLRDIDASSFMAFAADGWMSAGLYIAWPMILFTVLGSHYAALGIANAAAALFGAVIGYVCGHGIDRGRRGLYLNFVCLVLVAGFLLRSAASFSPLAAGAASLSSAAVTAVYSLVLMSTLYERAQQSGAAFRFHFATEAAWDLGAVSGCLTIAALALQTADNPSLAVLPAAAGITVVYGCVRVGAKQVKQALLF